MLDGNQGGIVNLNGGSAPATGDITYPVSGASGSVSVGSCVEAGRPVSLYGNTGTKFSYKYDETRGWSFRWIATVW